VHLHEEPWSWTLDQMADGLALTVVCGTVGLYEKSVVLLPDEVRAWEQEGPAGLHSLVDAIRFDGTGKNFVDRYRPDLSPGNAGS